MPITISHSSTGRFIQCRRMYQLRKAGWKPKEDDANLIIGRAVHEGLAHWGVSKNDNEALTKALMVTVGLDENGIDVVASLLLGYFEEYKTDVLVTICTETDVTLPITPDINFRFKMDGVVEFEGKPWIKESKTTGQKPGAFWSKYAMDRQATGYIWGARKYFDLPIEGVLVDALFKPSSKVPIPTYDRQFFSPTPTMIESWLHDIKGVGEEMLRAEASKDYWKSWTCINSWGRKCEFFDYCSNDNSLDVLRTTHDIKERLKAEAENAV